MKRYWKKNKVFLAASLAFGLLASVLTTGVSIVLQKVIDAAAEKQMEIFRNLFIFTIVYMLALCTVNFLSSLSARYLTKRMIRQYRQDIFEGIMSRRPAWFHEENTADYLSALTFLLMFLIPAVIGKTLEKRQDLVSRQMSVFTEKIKDIFSGYDVLKSYNRIEAANNRFSSENETEAGIGFRAAKLFALNEGLSDTLSVLSTIMVIFAAAYLVLMGRISMGTLLALVQLSSTFMAPVILLLQNVPKIRSMKSVIVRLNGYTQGDSEAEERRKLLQGSPSFEHDIELRKVSFSYKKDRPVLCGAAMRFEKGKKYAIMGPSGCGKSTLLKLMTGYYENYDGKILYDGIELRALDGDQIAGLVSVIHQNVYLFNGTIRENILLDEEFSEGELSEAVEKSGVSLFSDEKEEGLDTRVGENGRYDGIYQMG